MKESWEKGLLKGLIRTSPLWELGYYQMKCYLPGKWESLGILRKQAAIKEFLSSLVVSHVCQCSYLEFKGFQATCLVFLLQLLQYLMIDIEWVICCWMNDSTLDRSIHPFIHFHNYSLSTYSAPSTMLVCRGRELGESGQCLFCFLLPWEFFYISWRLLSGIPVILWCFNICWWNH